MPCENHTDTAGRTTRARVRGCACSPTLRAAALSPPQPEADNEWVKQSFMFFVMGMSGWWSVNAMARARLAAPSLARRRQPAGQPPSHPATQPPSRPAGRPRPISWSSPSPAVLRRARATLRSLSVTADVGGVAHLHQPPHRLTRGEQHHQLAQRRLSGAWPARYPARAAPRARRTWRAGPAALAYACPRAAGISTRILG